MEGRPAPARAATAAPAEPAATSPAADASPAADPSTDPEGARAPAGPPEDATTSLEDLPHDLFGEEDTSPPEPVPDRSPDTESPAATRSRPHPPRTEAAAPSARTEAADDPGDDPIARVQALFPGRIVAIEAADPNAGAGAEPDAPDGVGDDGEAPTSG